MISRLQAVTAYRRAVSCMFHVVFNAGLSHTLLDQQVTSSRKKGTREGRR